MERKILQWLLLGVFDVEQMVTLLDAEDFKDEKHRLIFEAIQELAYEMADIDIITVSNQLKKDGHLEAVGGAAELVNICNEE